MAGVRVASVRFRDPLNAGAFIGVGDVISSDLAEALHDLDRLTHLVDDVAEEGESGSNSRGGPAPSDPVPKFVTPFPGSGKMQTILDWVIDEPKGDLLARAELALRAERGGKDRSTLIDALEKIVEGSKNG